MVRKRKTEIDPALIEMENESRSRLQQWTEERARVKAICSARQLRSGAVDEHLRIVDKKYGFTGIYLNDPITVSRR